MIERKRTSFNGERLVFEPGPPLASWVDGIRIGDAPEPADQPAPRRIVPDRSAHLIYYRFSAPGVLAGRAVPAGASGLSWVGPRSVFKDIERRGRAMTVIVSLQPGAGAGLVRHPVREIADVGVLAGEVLCDDVSRLVDRLDAAATTTAMIPIIADELGQLTERVQLDPLIGEAVRRIQASRVPLRLAALARDLGVGERSLRERFGRSVGLTPMRFARITRMNRVFDRMPCGPDGSWSRIAHEAGYADHSHMVRDFNALLGESPARFAARLENTA
jgi:AraC-like DNA-binding protein